MRTKVCAQDKYFLITTNSYGRSERGTYLRINMSEKQSVLRNSTTRIKQRMNFNQLC